MRNVFLIVMLFWGVQVSRVRGDPCYTVPLNYGQNMGSCGTIHKFLPKEVYHNGKIIERSELTPEEKNNLKNVLVARFGLPNHQIAVPLGPIALRTHIPKIWDAKNLFCACSMKEKPKSTFFGIGSTETRWTWDCVETIQSCTQEEDTRRIPHLTEEIDRDKKSRDLRKYYKLLLNAAAAPKPDVDATQTAAQTNPDITPTNPPMPASSSGSTQLGTLATPPP